MDNNTIDKPFISVLMATYNEKVEYLKESIESILNQTYSNFEFLICDDSTDQSAIELLNGYAAKDPRIVLVRGKERMGFVHSLNEGLKQAKGDWIARMDSDDIAFPNRLEEEVKYIHEGIGAIGSECINIDTKGDIIGKTIKTPYSSTMAKVYLWLGKTPIVHPTALINKEMLLSTGGYDENFKVVEDFDIWTRLVVTSKLINVPRPLLYYRVHENNVHILKADLIRKILCLGMIKYAFGIKKRLSEESYNRILGIVEGSRYYKMVKLENYNKGFVKLLLRLGIYPELPMLMLSIYYRLFKYKYNNV